MTISDYQAKWDLRFADNDDFSIGEADLREFKNDTASLMAATSGMGQALTELVLPITVIGGMWYLTPVGIWEASRSFNAASPPVPGPNWRRLANFKPTITAALIDDASPAGRALLTAGNVTEQLSLVDHLDIAAGQYGPHPAFSRAYTEAGLLTWLLKNFVKPVVVAAPIAPTPPTNGHADDSADIFYGTINPLYPALADYEIYYPGSNGPVSAANGRADLAGSTLTVRGLTGPNGVSSVGMRVAASGSRPASAWLTNAEAFTGVAALPEGILTFSVQGDDAIINFIVTPI